MEWNEFQSTPEELHLSEYPKEVQQDFWKYVNGVPFIQRLISKDRPRIKDLPKDGQGRAIIDLTNPPIIEDTDYFRPAAIRYLKTGKYTDLKPNPNPHSAFGKFIKEEVRRCWEGYTRLDGAWVTGDMYFYLNYSRIKLNKVKKDARDGERKKASQVEDFPQFWEGINWRMYGWKKARDDCKNYAEIARRGASKSYSAAAKLAKDFVLGEDSENQRNVSSMVVADTKEYLTSEGTLNKFEVMIDFLARNTEFPSKRLVSSIHNMEWQMGFKDLNTGTNMGTLNTVRGVAIKDEPDKPRGKRMTDIICEEFGKFPHLKELYNIMQPSVKSGDITFGMINLIGTGGSKGSNFEGARSMIYHPSGFDIEEFDNVWDLGQSGKGKSIFFFPAYINYEGCFNKDGISDVTKALLSVLVKRYNIKYGSEDPQLITQAIAENPITIQDSIMRTDISIFPVSALKERILQITSDPKTFNDVYVGKMVQKKSGDADFKPTEDKPIRFFPHKDNKLAGAIEIFTMPKKDRNGKVFSDRYIAGQDPYDDDFSNTMSLGSTFILDLWTDDIVAEYTGRPSFADDYYEQTRLLVMFFNARLNYENNKKGLYAYFRKMNCTYLLTDELDFLKDRDTSGDRMALYGNKLKGTNATLAINNRGRTDLRDWLMSPVPMTKVIDGKPQKVMVMRLYTLKTRALLEECAQWNPDGNFDRVSAMGMLMLLREDRMIKFGGDPKKKVEDDPNDLSNDKFFMEYDKKFRPDVYKDFEKKLIEEERRKKNKSNGHKESSLPYRL